jgi:hypothetical protein
MSFKFLKIVLKIYWYKSKKAMLQKVFHLNVTKKKFKGKSINQSINQSNFTVTFGEGIEFKKVKRFFFFEILL